jgi:hypothetical protein
MGRALTDLEKCAAIVEIQELEDRCALRPESGNVGYARYCLERAGNYLLDDDRIRVCSNILEARTHIDYEERLAPAGHAPIRWFREPWEQDD